MIKFVSISKFKGESKLANKSDFSSSEWALIKDAPYWVQTAITAAEGRMGLVEKRREAKALDDFLASYKASNELVRAVVAEAKDGKHDVNSKASLEEVGAKLEDIADAVEKKTNSREFDAFNEFLLDVGEAIAGAMSENMLNKKDTISDEEEEALHLISTALRATAADKAKRSAASAAEQRKKIQSQQKAAADARKRAADAKARAEAEKAAKEAEEKLAQLQAQLKKDEEEQKKREELAKKQEALREARRKRMVEARKKADAAKEKAAAEANTYVVQPGDSLSAIALEKLGSANAWKKIYEANKDKIKNPSLIYPGQELVIPSA